MRLSTMIPGMLVLLAAVERSAPAAEPATKAALIARETSDAGKSLLDLAQVELTDDKRVELLERQAINRVLTEQKLSLTGLVDAGAAVKIGKLLSVDLFAIIEIGGPKKEAFAIIIYDVVTGLRYVDQSIPDKELSEQARSVAEGVRAAVDKRGKDVKALKSLSLLAVRNADLPQDRDTTCRSLALILERQILGSPNVAMLERKRLETLNQEKQLPTESRARELLSSVLVMDLQFGKAKSGKGLRATALISDGTGKELHRESVEGQESSGSDVVEPLHKGLLKFLKEAPPSRPMDRKSESLRFAREAEIAWSHKDRVPALEALEAAYALDAANAETRARLATYLGDYGYVLLNPKTYTTYGGRRPQLRTAPEKVKASLRLTIRALGLYEDSLQQLTDPTPQALNISINRHQLVLWLPYFNSLGYLDERDLDDEARELRDELEQACIRLMQTQKALREEIVRQDPSQFRSFAFHLGACYYEAFFSRKDGPASGTLRTHYQWDYGSLEAGLLSANDGRDTHQLNSLKVFGLQPRIAELAFPQVFTRLHGTCTGSGLRDLNLEYVRQLARPWRLGARPAPPQADWESRDKRQYDVKCNLFFRDQRKKEKEGLRGLLIDRSKVSAQSFPGFVFTDTGNDSCSWVYVGEYEATPGIEQLGNRVLPFWFRLPDGARHTPSTDKTGFEMSLRILQDPWLRVGWQLACRIKGSPPQGPHTTPEWLFDQLIYSCAGSMEARGLYLEVALWEALTRTTLDACSWCDRDSVDSYLGLATQLLENRGLPVRLPRLDGTPLLCSWIKQVLRPLNKHWDKIKCPSCGARGSQPGSIKLRATRMTSDGTIYGALAPYSAPLREIALFLRGFQNGVDG